MTTRHAVLGGYLVMGCFACGGTDAGSAAGVATTSDSSEELAVGSACTPFGDPPRPLVDGGAGPMQACNANGADKRSPMGTLLGPWPDPDGTPRYACLFLPATTTPVPLLVYLHPSLSDADGIRDTNILSFLDTTSLYADGKNPGFAVLAPEGRDTLHYYAAPDQKGTGWDIWYRQFSASAVQDGAEYAPNVDGLAVDQFVSEAEATGRVDSTRTFVSGWSNGASFGYAYGFFRTSVKAIAVYSAGTSPFGGGTDPCPQTPVLGAPNGDGQIQLPRTDLQVYQVHNACDIGNSCPTVVAFDKQLANLGVSVKDVIVDGGDVTNACASSCNLITGAAHHFVWPSTFTQQMLAFLAAVP